jgi:hypothetical protein
MTALLDHTAEREADVLTLCAAAGSLPELPFNDGGWLDSSGLCLVIPRGGGRFPKTGLSQIVSGNTHRMATERDLEVRPLVSETSLARLL